MDLCAEVYRIPHSEFLSWDKLDRDKAIWQFINSRQKCPNCGTKDDEWDPEAGGDLHAYSAKIKRCRGCEVRQMAQESDQAQGRGVYIQMVKNRRNPYGHHRRHGSGDAG